MFEKNDDYNDEISLIDLIKLLYGRKWFIIKFTLIISLISIAYSLYVPEIYKSEALLAPKSNTQGSLSQMTGSIGGIAALAGLDIGSLGAGSENRSKIAFETLQSRRFFSEYLYENMLVELMAAKDWDRVNNEIIIDQKIYDSKKNVWAQNENGSSGKPSHQKAFKKFQDIFDVYENKLTGFITINIEHYSPHIAKTWVDLIVHSINESMRQIDINNSEKSLQFLVTKLSASNQVTMNNVFSNLIEEQTKIRMLADIADDYVFVTIDPAIANEVREKPKRTIMVMSSMLLSGFAASLYILISQYYFRKRDNFKKKNLD